jgi:hypothetical protein
MAMLILLVLGVIIGLVATRKFPEEIDPHGVRGRHE